MTIEMSNPARAPYRTAGMLLLLLAALLLVSCSAPAPEPTQPPQPTEAPEIGQTITLITPDAGNLDTAESAKYQIQTRLTDFKLLGPSDGIAWGVTRNTLRIYMTRDNGLTWVNISPSQGIQFAASLQYGKNIYFTDPQNGWIIRSAFGMMESVILNTSDGGASWKVSALPDGNKPASLYFVTPASGWLLNTWDSSRFKESKALYTTEDGGASWRIVMHNEHYTPGTPNPAIPMNGVLSGQHFRNSNSGLAVLQTSGIPSVYLTDDGGVTWEPSALLEAGGLPERCSVITAGNPVFFNAAEGWFPAGCVSEKEGTVSHYGYFTDSYGKEWTLVPFALDAQSGVNRGQAPFFIDYRTGWTIVDGVVYRTLDQGKTWRQLPESGVLQAQLEQFPEMVKLQFITRDVGWLLIEKKEDRRSILLQTTNGGVNWRVM